jgi:hypothetical protein
VYLALGGREFHLDRPGLNDFRANDSTRIRLGVSNNIEGTSDPDRNDPKRFFPIDTDDVASLPRWLRLDGGDSLWEILDAKVTITPATGPVQELDLLPGSTRIFLGQGVGQHLFF